MPVKVTLYTGMIQIGNPGARTDEQVFIIRSRKDYAAVGFAAARWARAAIREARMLEGADHAELRMVIDFMAEAKAEPGAGEAPKRKRRKKAEE